MGKSNRIRVNRANENAKTLGVKNKPKGMPSWAMSLITVILAVALLLSVSGILLSQNGVFTRMTNIASGGKYKVDANMMAYYYNMEYQNFYNSYGTYASSLGFDTSKALDEQAYGGGEGSSTISFTKSLLGDFTGTWHDYFMKEAVDTVKATLMYCQVADELGITLSEEDIASIDEQLEAVQTAATSYGYPSVSSFLSANYGKGVSEGDIRKCMEYSTLASKAMTKVVETIDGNVTEDEVKAKYEEGENSLNYDAVDYTYYTFKVSYDDAAKKILEKADYTEAEVEGQKDKILAEYKSQIVAAQAAANALKEKTDIDSFKAYIYNYVAEKAVEDAYDTNVIKKSSEVKGELVIDDGAIKAELVKAIIAEAITEDKETVTKVHEIPSEAGDDYAYEIYGVSMPKKLISALNTVKSNAFSTVKSATTTYNREKASYTKDNTFSEWAFKNAEAKDGAIKLIAEQDASDGNGNMVTDDNSITKDKGESQISVYLITKQRYKDTEKSRNFSYIAFSTKEEAEAAIAELMAGGSLTQEAFNAIAEAKVAAETAVGYQNVTDYTDGGGYGDEIDEWVFETAKNSGDLTTAPITVTETSSSSDGSTTSSTAYVVALYEGEGEELWYLNVKSVIVDEKYEAEKTRLEGAHPVTVYDNRLKFVNTVA